MARILIIDDDELVRATVKAALELAEHEVVVAENGERGVAMFGGAAFDLVVTDIIMPEKEGIETIIELRQRDPTVKIIAISGGGRTSNQIFLDVAKKFGAVDVLAKPFTPKQLLATVEKALIA
jgi:DNA-binding response OmpR family regulator